MNIIDFLKQLLGWKITDGVNEYSNRTEDNLINEPQVFTPSEDENPFAPKKADTVNIEIKVSEDVLKKPSDLAVEGPIPTNVSQGNSQSKAFTDSIKSYRQSGETSDGRLSLLDNKPYMSLSESVCSVIEKIDSLMDSTESSDAKKQLKFIKHKLREAFNGTGADTISDETVFDGIRHIPIGDDLIKQGELIDIVEDGLSIEERVMIPAKVKPLKKE